MRFRFNKEQCQAFEEILIDYSISPGTKINGHDMGVHFENIKSYLDAQLLVQEQGLETCPVCNLNPYKVMGMMPCKHCGMIGQMPWPG